jgi:hypothetical protein
MKVKPVYLLGIWALACALASPAHAIPPPPERPPHEVSLPDNGCAILIEEEVRAYDFVSVRFIGRVGDKLVMSLAGDPERHLRLQLRALSGKVIEVPRGSDGIAQRVKLLEDGSYQLVVAMDGDLARTGRAIRFVLALSRRSS